jgi:hypothetical protein
MRATIHSLLKGYHEKRSNLFRILLLMDEHLERRFLTWLRLEMPSMLSLHPSLSGMALSAYLLHLVAHPVGLAAHSAWTIHSNVGGWHISP